MSEQPKKIPDKTMAELRQGYRALKGNANATDAEIADYLYTAFRLAILPQFSKRSDREYDGFYALTEEAAQYTRDALNAIRSCVFKEKLSEPFTIQPHDRSGVFRLAITEEIVQSEFEGLRKQLVLSLGATSDAMSNPKTLPKGLHDKKFNALDRNGFMYFASLLHIQSALAFAQKKEDGSSELTYNQAALLTEALPMVYRRSFETGKFGQINMQFLSDVTFGNIRKDVMTLPKDQLERMQKDFEQATMLGRMHGERYFFQHFREISLRDNVPVNPQFQPIRDFLDATIGLHLDGNRLYIHDLDPEKTSVVLQKLIAPVTENPSFNSEDHCFELSAEAMESYKGAMARAHKFIATGKPMQVAKELVKTDGAALFGDPKKWSMSAIGKV
jgi:hypothetical protein